MSEGVTTVGLIDPESPERLRDLVTALAKHTGAEVLRFEVGLGPSTREGYEQAIIMTVTHSLGPKHEETIGPMLADAFAATLRALAQNAAEADAAACAGPATEEP